MIRRHGQIWVSADEAAALLGDDVNAAMIRKWAYRGLIKRHTYRSRTIYLWSQVQAAEARTRASRVGRKRGGDASETP